MSDSMSGTFGQRDLGAADPLHRVDPLDRDSPDRENNREDEPRRKRERQRLRPPPEDSVQISEAARRALEQAREDVDVAPAES
jgi:hypothetical protein